MASVSVAPSVRVVVGVDTHKYVHVTAALNATGELLGTHTIATDAFGFAQLLEWANALGTITAFGVEGTGSYGAGLASFVRRHGYRVVAVSRPDRRLRRLHGKSDPLDAEHAARAVLASTATAVPKTADGTVEMIRERAEGRSRYGRQGAYGGDGDAQGDARTRPRRLVRGVHRHHPARLGAPPGTIPVARIRDAHRWAILRVADARQTLARSWPSEAVPTLSLRS